MKEKLKTVGMAVAILVGGIGIGRAYDAFQHKTMKIPSTTMSPGDVGKFVVVSGTETTTISRFTIPTGRGISSARARGAIRFTFD